MVRRNVGGSRSPERAEENVLRALSEAVAQLRAAGVDGQLCGRSLRDETRLASRAWVVDPTAGNEEVRAESRLADLSALFDVNAGDGSRFN